MPKITRLTGLKGTHYFVVLSVSGLCNCPAPPQQVADTIRRMSLKVAKLPLIPLL